MALLVVPLAAEQTHLLTLGEWDALVACDKVMFERNDHPLLGRLRSGGVNAGPFDDEPEADLEGAALVAEPDSARVVALARAGARVSAGAASGIDALTAAHAAPGIRRAAASLAEITAVMARLRSDDGCPWDREQTHASLKVHLLEESYEVLDAIDRGQIDDELEEELGDVLLQVAFHARLAEQDERFNIADVADRIVAKLLYRHPHVFGETTVHNAQEVLANWEALKADEKPRSGPFDDIPAALPALLQAYKTQKRAARLGFAVDEDDARRRLEQGLSDDLGDALFWLVALARARGIDPEGALRAATARFRDSYT